jgi:hypothetical protein
MVFVLWSRSRCRINAPPTREKLVVRLDPRWLALSIKTRLARLEAMRSNHRGIAVTLGVFARSRGHPWMCMPTHTYMCFIDLAHVR